MQDTKIDVPQPDHIVRLYIDHHKHRHAVVMCVCRVEPLADGFESIPLSSMKHYPAAPAIRKSAAQIASVAHHIRPRAEDIARAYENNDDDAIKQILMSIFPFGG